MHAPSRFVLVLLLTAAPGCSWLFHKPRPDPDIPPGERAWLVRCEWLEPDPAAPTAPPRNAGRDWATDASGQPSGARRPARGRLPRRRDGAAAAARHDPHPPACRRRRARDAGDPRPGMHRDDDSRRARDAAHGPPGHRGASRRGRRRQPRPARRRAHRLGLAGGRLRRQPLRRRQPEGASPPLPGPALLARALQQRSGVARVPERPRRSRRAGPCLRRRHLGAARRHPEHHGHRRPSRPVASTSSPAASPAT